MEEEEEEDEKGRREAVNCPDCKLVSRSLALSLSPVSPLARSHSGSILPEERTELEEERRRRSLKWRRRRDAAHVEAELWTFS